MKYKNNSKIKEVADMNDYRTWEEFRNTGMLWFVNRLLHVMGWVIVTEFDPTNKKVVGVYPARTKFRGFTDEVEDEGFKRVAQYIADNAETLKEEANG
jgi:hypothetical protein